MRGVVLPGFGLQSSLPRGDRRGALVGDRATKNASDGFLEIDVECYSGYTAEETPRHFMLGPRRVEVVQVLDRWLAPDHRYFKIEGDDGGTYILRHDVAGERWELTMIEYPDSSGTPSP
jgi:hypothetical protein